MARQTMAVMIGVLTMNQEATSQIASGTESSNIIAFPTKVTATKKHGGGERERVDGEGETMQSYPWKLADITAAHTMNAPAQVAATIRCKPERTWFSH